MGVVGISDKLLHEKKEQLLMARWREPTLSLHGIEGAFDEPGAKTVIPRLLINRHTPYEILTFVEFFF